nr:transcription initiation factor TFIID subunit 13-like isoform X2 [Ziziphus jujuba var. spinosa]
MSNPSTGPSSKPRAGISQLSETSFKRKRGVFQKELQHMMYGFGDDPNPLPESVALMEDIVVEYITDLVYKAQDIGSKRGKLSVEDFLYQIRKIPCLHPQTLAHLYLFIYFFGGNNDCIKAQEALP